MNFGTLLNWLEKKATQYVHANLRKQTELQLAAGEAGRLLGGRAGRQGSQACGAGSPSPAAGTVAACGRMEWMRKVWYLERQPFQRPSA